MRDPLNLNQVEFDNSGNGILHITNMPEFDIEDYDLFDEKDMARYLKSIERIVRGSFEYKRLIQFLRNYMDMNKCSFYENVNNIDTSNIKIEIHHEPITLYDICVIVYNKRSFYRESLDEHEVAKEVTWLHYDLMVGLIPLAETVHELVHNQYIFVPTDKVMGRYKDFVEMYKDFMTVEQLNVLDRIEETTKFYNEDYQTILDRNYIYIDTTGSYTLPPMEAIQDMLQNRINTLKQKGPGEELIRPICYVDDKK